MREIKFRGKRIDNGELVYGDLIQLYDGRKFIINNKFWACIDDKGNFLNTSAPFVCEVISETIGQFTGLKDRNDNEIYEGDIITIQHPKLYAGYYEKPSVVKWSKDRSGFYEGDTCWAIGIYAGMYNNKNDLTIIGNIYNNPELLSENKGVKNIERD